MDWGIVASVVVAIALFMLGMMVICMPVFLFMAGSMRKTIAAGGVPKCPMPFCPFHKDIAGATKTARSVGQVTADTNIAGGPLFNSFGNQPKENLRANNPG